MKKPTWAGLSVLGLFLFFAPAPAVTKDPPKKKTAPVKPHSEVLDVQNSFAAVAEAVKPAVVNISAVQIQTVQEDPYQFFFGDPNEFFYKFFGEEGPQPPGAEKKLMPRQFRLEGTGSGVIIDADGTILTNHHVIQSAQQLTVTLGNGKTYKGQVVGTDPRLDIAIIKIKGPSTFPFVPFGDSDAMRIGDWALALGSPFGFEQTVTAGIISAIRQSLVIEGKNFRNLLQTDASINQGNSGGPLVNIKGEVIGINTAIFAPTGVFSGIGFAVPINEAKSVLKELIQKGYVERSWIGVEVAPVDDVIAQQFGLKSKGGALVNEVIPNSPAEKAGIQRGDVIVEFDRKKIKDLTGLQDIVSATDAKKTVSVKVIRNGKARQLELRTESLPHPDVRQGPQKEPVEEPEESTEKTTWLGATVANATPLLRRRYAGHPRAESPEVQGVILIEVSPDSAAAEAGLMVGDIIRSINRTAVKNVSDLQKIKVDLKMGVVFDVLRRGQSFFLSYKRPQ